MEWGLNGSRRLSGTRGPKQGRLGPGATHGLARRRVEVQPRRVGRRCAAARPAGASRRGHCRGELVAAAGLALCHAHTRHALARGAERATRRGRAVNACLAIAGLLLQHLVPVQEAGIGAAKSVELLLRNGAGPERGDGLEGDAIGGGAVLVHGVGHDVHLVLGVGLERDLTASRGALASGALLALLRHHGCAAQLGAHHLDHLEHDHGEDVQQRDGDDGDDEAGDGVALRGVVGGLEPGRVEHDAGQAREHGHEEEHRLDGVVVVDVLLHLHRGVLHHRLGPLGRHGAAARGLAVGAGNEALDLLLLGGALLVAPLGENVVALGGVEVRHVLHVERVGAEEHQQHHGELEGGRLLEQQRGDGDEELASKDDLDPVDLARHEELVQAAHVLAQAVHLELAGGALVLLLALGQLHQVQELVLLDVVLVLVQEVAGHDREADHVEDERQHGPRHERLLDAAGQAALLEHHLQVRLAVGRVRRRAVEHLEDGAGEEEVEEVEHGDEGRDHGREVRVASLLVHALHAHLVRQLHEVDQQEDAAGDDRDEQRAHEALHGAEALHQALGGRELQVEVERGQDAEEHAEGLGPVDLAAREDGQHLEEVHGDDADGHADVAALGHVGRGDADDAEADEAEDDQLRVLRAHLALAVQAVVALGAEGAALGRVAGSARVVADAGLGGLARQVHLARRPRGAALSGAVLVALAAVHVVHPQGVVAHLLAGVLLRLRARIRARVRQVEAPEARLRHGRVDLVAVAKGAHGALEAVLSRHAVPRGLAHQRHAHAEVDFGEVAALSGHVHGQVLAASAVPHHGAADLLVARPGRVDAHLGADLDGGLGLERAEVAAVDDKARLALGVGAAGVNASDHRRVVREGRVGRGPPGVAVEGRVGHAGRHRVVVLEAHHAFREHAAGDLAHDLRVGVGHNLAQLAVDGQPAAAHAEGRPGHGQPGLVALAHVGHRGAAARRDVVDARGGEAPQQVRVGVLLPRDAGLQEPVHAGAGADAGHHDGVVVRQHGPVRLLRGPEVALPLQEQVAEPAEIRAADDHVRAALRGRRARPHRLQAGGAVAEHAAEGERHLAAVHLDHQLHIGCGALALRRHEAGVRVPEVGRRREVGNREGRWHPRAARVAHKEAGAVDAEVPPHNRHDLAASSADGERGGERDRGVAVAEADGRGRGLHLRAAVGVRNGHALPQLHGPAVALAARETGRHLRGCPVARRGVGVHDDGRGAGANARPEHHHAAKAEVRALEHEHRRVGGQLDRHRGSAFDDERDQLALPSVSSAVRRDTVAHRNAGDHGGAELNAVGRARRGLGHDVLVRVRGRLELGRGRHVRGRERGGRGLQHAGARRGGHADGRCCGRQARRGCCRHGNWRCCRKHATGRVGGCRRGGGDGWRGRHRRSSCRRGRRRRSNRRRGRGRGRRRSCRRGRRGRGSGGRRRGGGRAGTAVRGQRVAVAGLDQHGHSVLLAHAGGKGAHDGRLRLLAAAPGVLCLVGGVGEGLDHAVVAADLDERLAAHPVAAAQRDGRA
mmetsp:Transcript_16565/g.62666  ORF Transcript_16565/g.62666 Transcript_16565/m.62666 type:complete len:1522 (-) Transcript_16565:1717-6282(-)